MLREGKTEAACGCASGENGKRNGEKEERAEEKEDVWRKIWAMWMLKNIGLSSVFGMKLLPFAWKAKMEKNSFNSLGVAYGKRVH